MAIAAAMNGHHHPGGDDGDDNDDRAVDAHEHDVVMPGFRFHPTEEELVEFYLRRKVEGKPFNVEVITFLDLYRYDPWELPALATMRGKEWFFYVPRDRKYRNGDRPNRVTTSGYWKATGADRMIKTESSSRPIGLKKTLVFYSGKAPKGVRTSWIMNEYRLPQNETDRYNKAEISLCRVYKRTGVEDHHQLPGTHSSRPSSSRSTSSGSSKKQSTNNRHPTAPPAANPFQSTCPRGDHYNSASDDMANMPEAAVDLTTMGGAGPDQQGTAAPALQDTAAAYVVAPPPSLPLVTTTQIPPMPEDVDATSADQLHHSKDMNALVSACALLSSSSSSTSLPAATVDELGRLVGSYHQSYGGGAQPSTTHLFPLPSPTSQLPPLTSLPSSLAAFTDRLWEWNPIAETDRDYSSFK